MHNHNCEEAKKLRKTLNAAIARVEILKNLRVDILLPKDVLDRARQNAAAEVEEASLAMREHAAKHGCGTLELS